MSDTRRRILLQLSDGAEHSGTAIADRLNISRAAVWKHIKALQADGVAITSSAANGYCIPGGMQLLSMEDIQHALGEDIAWLEDIHLVNTTNSTNDWLMSRLQGEHALPSGTVCLTERQTDGRGTRGRRWQSPYGSNLYISLYWRFDCGPMELGGLSLSMAAIIGKSLHEAGAKTIRIKWPNDLYTADGKLGGILIDMMAEVSGPSHVVIGVGLNLGMPVEHHASIDQPVADLRNTGLRDTLGRSELAALVIRAIAQGCRQFSREGFAGFRQDWMAQDMVTGQQVNLVNGDRVITGKACGVDDMGAIELLTESGRQAFSSGEVTLRLA
jgi:BirA family biotin operon repressor/biotin-[acetyl-CoA-carboxylase] ligase